MTFVSYAPNCEDVPLWRALGHVAAGRYLDIGAEADAGPSVTRAFYDRGWSGVSVRPDLLAGGLAAARPRDTVVTDTASLSMDGPVHFLRVATGEQDAAILRALDLTNRRPWIVVVRADERCDAVLAEAGYRAALYDGMNRFHLSADHPELHARLAAPANALDGFVRADAAGAERFAAIQAMLETAEARVDGSTRRLVDALRAAGLARDDVGRMTGETAWLRGLNAEAREAEGRSRSDAAWMRGQLEAARRAAEERSAQLLARTEEAAWLRGCLADAEARIGTAEARTAEARAQAGDELRRRAEAEAHAHASAIDSAALRGSLSWRVTAPLRRLRGRPVPTPMLPLPPPPPPAPAIAAPAPAAAPASAAPSPVHTAPPRADMPPPRATLPAAAPPPPEPAVAARPEPPSPKGSPRLPVTAVHQFHAGSASGDAITNAMLLIRGQLRAAGFRSDIFVENRGPGLGQDIKLLDSMPAHDGIVLLFHHSMGFPSFPDILALPARKVLVYHNITPPELLAGIPRIQALARIGREQLAALPGQVAFALADSDYNALELHRLGFSAVRTCTLLFDVDAMTRRAVGPRLDDGVFTVLFVGRVTPSKAQAELVDAFAAFRTRFGRPCRLVLVGALDADEHAFIAAIQARIAASGLDGDVQLTGLVSERELHDWYRQADLYVSLSRHEGFGVPLVEAMAHGIPVVAWPTGAVPFTLGEAGMLLTSRDPADVADAMMVAAANRAGWAAQGARSIRRWALDRQMPVLMEALAAAGAVPPRDAASHDALAANMQVTVCGHVAKTYSLAAVNRGLARTIEAQRPGTVRLVPVEGERTDDLSEVPEAERGFVAALAARTRPDTGPELVLSGHYPLHAPAERGDLLAALFFWEESLVPAATVTALNDAFDAVFAPSAFVAKALVDSGVAVPVLNIGQAPDLSGYAALDPARVRAGPFTVLHVSSAFPRKGVDVLLAAWARAFTAADAVRLVVKAFPNPHNDAAGQIARFRAGHPDAAPIELVDADLPPEAMLALYRDASVMVLPTRGEGYNLPAAEAMAAGLPVIVTAQGGHLDFCTRDTARLVARHLAPSGSHIAPPHSLWAEPDVDDLAAALREAHAGTLDGLREPARQAVRRQTDAAAFTARLTAVAARLLLAPPPAPMRLGWVSSWDVRCGIAEYSRALVDALPRDGLAEPVILADGRTPPARHVRAAWRAGDTASVDGLLAAVAREDADVTMIQHQPGLLPWPALARLLDGMHAAGQAAVVTLHNTTHLLDLAEPERQAVVPGLGRAARLLVHTLADVDRLDRLGLSRVTTLLPHPAPEPASQAVRALPDDAAPVIGCTGFFLPDKGIRTLIAATARLRSRWPGIRLRLVNAEYGDPSSAAEIAACRRLAAAEGLAVEWHTDFVSLAEQQALLRGCDLIVLPYQHSKEASSAALRSALATGIPVAVTPLAVFAEAEGAVFRLPGVASAAIALGVAKLLGSAEQRTDLSERARAWMGTRALPDVARRLHGMLLGLAAQGRMGQATDGSAWQRPM